MSIDGEQPDEPHQARAQDGVFTLAQAMAEGLTRRQARSRLEAGRWHRIAGRGLSATPPPRQGWPARSLAWAAHLTWPDAVIGYRVAAALHGFPVEAGSQVHVLLPRRRQPYAQLVPHYTPVPDSDVLRSTHAPAVTTAARTAVDCLSTLPPDQAWDLFAWLSTRRRITRDELTCHLTYRTGLRGTGQLRAVHAQSAKGAVSAPEIRLHRLLRAAGITGWRAGARVYDSCGLIGVVDLLFDRARVVVEIDGYAYHSRREAFVDDRRRQNRLVAAGYVVLRFTWWDLTGNPAGVVHQIRAALPH